MAGYCLRDGRIQKMGEENVSWEKWAAVFHLAAGGKMRKEVSEVPVLSEGEGVLAYAGEFYVEPLEVQIEFLKAANGRKWLETLVLRHTDRVRQVSEALLVMAEIKEVKP